MQCGLNADRFHVKTGDIGIQVVTELQTEYLVNA